MAVLPRRVLEARVDARLKEIANLTVYLRRVGHVIGTPDDVPPPTVSENDLRVRPYVVQHPSPGRAWPNRRLVGYETGIGWTTQLTCVTGDEEGLGPLVDAVSARFDNWLPTFAAPHADKPARRFRLLNDPGPSQRDEDVRPPRYWVPLIYQLPVGH